MRLTPLCLSLSLLVPAVAADRVSGRSFATRSEVMARNGMACTSQPLATQIALDVLKAGGTAVDAAIAANAALGLMEPTGSGVGGDLFALVWDPATSQLYGYNGSGRSPKGMRLEDLKAKGLKAIPSRGPLAVSVPGCVDGWFALHGRFGRLSMAQVLEGAIRYAKEGFPVSPVIAGDWGRGLEVLGDQPGFRETFSVDGVRAPKAGDIFRNPRLAATYEALARDGRNAFYRGAIARDIVDTLKRQGGYLSEEDLAQHRGEWVRPHSVNYRGVDVWELPPNGQGLTVLQMLNILKGFDFKNIPFGSVEHIHRFVEAKKLAFEDRARYFGDPAFNRLPIDGLLDERYAEQRRTLIGERAASRVDAGHLPLKEGDTVYLTVADRYGMMVSLIQSNYRGMGSGVTPPHGFCLQNRGELFTLEEGQANTYAPGKRPFHTIIPGFATKDGRPFLSFGVMGGEFQPLGHVQILMNILDFGMSVQEAGDAPRIAHEGGHDPAGAHKPLPGRIQLESGFSPEVIQALMRRGHDVTWMLGGYGGYQAIQFDAQRGVYFGASESRKDGEAAGY